MYFQEAEILLFFASLIRVSTLFMLLPIFGDSTVPPMVRIFLAFTVNLIVYPVAKATYGVGTFGSNLNDVALTFLVLREALLGFVIGFTAKMFFEGISFAFSHAGSQMGFNMASAFDTQSETTVPVISQLIMILAMLLFLAMDGHHVFVKALVESYQVVPVGEFALSKTVVAYVLETSSSIFWIAVKLSAPMALVIFLINCAFGIVAKAVPQINVLVVSFTVNIMAGFFVIALTLPVFGTSVSEIFLLMMGKVSHLMTLLA